MKQIAVTYIAVLLPSVILSALVVYFNGSAIVSLGTAAVICVQLGILFFKESPNPPLHTLVACIVTVVITAALLRTL